MTVAAHGRGAALGGVLGRAVLPDLLAVAALCEEPDGQRRAEQRQHHARRPRRRGWSSQRLPPRSAPARRAAGSPQREALTRTTSPGPEPVLDRGRPPRRTSGTCSSSPRQAGSALAPASIGAASSPTTISPVRPAPRRPAPTCSCSSVRLAAQLAHRPEHGERAPPRAIDGQRRQRRPDGLGVSVVGVVDTVTPSGRSVTSIRHLLRATAADSPSATAGWPRPSWPASAAAASALVTLCSPCSRSRTGACPGRVTRREARPGLPRRA